MSRIVLVTTNTRALGITNEICGRKKLKVVLKNLPDLVILTEVCVSITAWVEWWTKFRFELAKYTGEFLENGRRGIIALVKKPLKFESRITINEDILKLVLRIENKSIAIFATYAPSQGNNSSFFNKLRESQLNSEEDFQIITGDLNTTLDPELDRTGYAHDSHWRSREVINTWMEDEQNGMIDAYRYCNPDKRQYTYCHDKRFRKRARLDYILMSGNLAQFLKKSYIVHCPWDISDHSPCYAELQFEQLQEGPGTFRCAYGMNKIPEYNLMTKHIIHETVTDISNLNMFSKALEHANNKIIYKLSISLNNETITPEQRMILGISLSLQKTKGELLDLGTEIESENTLDYVIKKVGLATRVFQKDFKKLKTDAVDRVNAEIRYAEENGDPDRLAELDGVLNELMNTICSEEAERMSTFRLLHDERPSKAMIELEKSMTG